MDKKGTQQRRWHPQAWFVCALALFLTSCSFPGVYSSNAQLPAARPLQQQSTLPPLRLPQDEAPHTDLTEWWYYTGHMEAKAPGGKVQQYGFEFVIFQALRSNLPPTYAAHFAITDISKGTFQYDQRRQMEPGAVIPNGTSTSGIDISLNEWRIQGLNGHDHLNADMQNYAIDFSLQAQKPATLHNGNGLITEGLSGFSYYYSRTDMLLSGTLRDHNQLLAVSGKAWMDHQWGNFLAVGGGGWDWYSIQLDNQTELMLYFIHDPSGQLISTYAGYIDERGRETLLAPGAIRSTVLDNWTSPATGITYPSGWSSYQAQ